MSLSQAQRARAEQLAQEYGINPSRIRFFDGDEPWIPPDELMAIARRVGNFQEVGEEFSQFVPALNQVIYSATVVDKDNRIFKRSGVATVGEGGADGPNEHTLAAHRALSAVLTAAGFNPLKSGVGSANKRIQHADEAVHRNSQLAAIHKLAEKAGLIMPKRGGLGGRRDIGEYRVWLMENFGVETAAVLNETERAQAINLLRVLAGEVEPSNA